MGTDVRRSVRPRASRPLNLAQMPIDLLLPCSLASTNLRGPPRFAIVNAPQCHFAALCGRCRKPSAPWSRRGSRWQHSTPEDWMTRALIARVWRCALMGETANPTSAEAVQNNTPPRRALLRSRGRTILQAATTTEQCIVSLGPDRSVQPGESEQHTSQGALPTTAVRPAKVTGRCWLSHDAAEGRQQRAELIGSSSSGLVPVWKSDCVKAIPYIPPGQCLASVQ